MIRWVDRTIVSLTKHLMFQALFFFIISYRLGALKTNFFSLWKSKLKQFLKRILQEIMKEKTILGTSDARYMSRLSHWPFELLYYCIEDWRISSQCNLYCPSLSLDSYHDHQLVIILKEKQVQCKVRIFWEAHKIWKKNLPLRIWR